MKQPHLRLRQRVTIGGRSWVNERGALKPFESPILLAACHLALSPVKRVPGCYRLDDEKRTQHGNGSDQDHPDRMIWERHSPDRRTLRLSQPFHRQDYPGE